MGNETVAGFQAGEGYRHTRALLGSRSEGKDFVSFMLLIVSSSVSHRQQTCAARPGLLSTVKTECIRVHAVCMSAVYRFIPYLHRLTYYDNLVTNQSQKGAGYLSGI